MIANEPHRKFVETITLPAVLLFLLCMPAAVSGYGFALVLDAQWRGLFALIVPAFLAKGVWDSCFDPHSRYSGSAYLLLSWFAGLPIGWAARAIVHLWAS